MPRAGAPGGQFPGSAPPSSRSGLRAVTAATLAAAYLLVVLGDTVRVTESGMGCRSWPLCNGQAGLTGTYHAMLEQAHRYLAAIVTTLVAATLVTAWRRARSDRLVFRSAVAAAALIGVQVLLGAITVWLHNADWTVALHLAGAWLLVAAVTVATLGAWRAAPAPGPGRAAGRAVVAGRAGAVAAACLFGLAVSGMLVLHTGASKACPGWPACGRGTGPVGLVLLQYIHRAFGLLAAAAVAVAAWRALRRPAAARFDRSLAWAGLVLLALTAAFGALVATTGAPPAAQDLHLAVASALWIVVVGLATPAPLLADPRLPAGSDPLPQPSAVTPVTGR